MQKVVVQILRAPIGGIRKHVLDIMNELSNDKIKQIFITNVLDSDVDISYLSSNENIEIYHVNISESPGMQDIKNIFKIFQILSNKKIDIIHGHGAKGGLYARVLAKLFGSKCIYTPHGGSLHRVHGKIKNYIYDLIEKLMVPLTDLFIFESHYSMQLFAENVANPGSRSLVNYNGVDFKLLPTEHIYKKKQPLKFASFGLLRELKGHDIVIRACEILNQENIPFEYVIYGNGDFENVLRNLIKKLKLEQKVRIEKYADDVYEKMKLYDFIVHPSRFESFGYVPVEAISLNIPVISSNEGGLKEVVLPEYGFIAFNNTPIEYASILRSIYDGNGKLEEKILLGNSFVKKHFSKKAMISKLCDVYLSI